MNYQLAEDLAKRLKEEQSRRREVEAKAAMSIKEKEELERLKREKKQRRDKHVSRVRRNRSTSGKKKRGK